jgi:predicted enzyme related to lactoylglutathione lyase
MGNAVVHFEVMAQDRARLGTFYRDLFGWTIDTDNPMGYGVISHADNHSVGGIGIGGGLFGDMPAGQDGVTFYVEVDDVDATLQQVEALGGKRLMGPEQFEGGPKFGHLLDPEGHWIGLLEKGTGGPSAQIPADAPRTGSPVVHFEVIGKDYATLESFYGALFGWKPNTDNAVGYGVIARDDNLTDDGIGIGGGIMALPPEMAAGSNGHVTFYVEVEDLDAVMDRAAALGGQRLNGPTEVPDGPTLGQIADPEGHLIGLTQAATA